MFQCYTRHYYIFPCTPHLTSNCTIKTKIPNQKNPSIKKTRLPTSILALDKNTQLDIKSESSINTDAVATDENLINNNTVINADHKEDTIKINKDKYFIPKKLNAKIIKNYEMALIQIKEIGPGEPGAISILNEFYENYHSILKDEHNLNYVNVATMLYKTAKITRELNCHDLIFDKHLRLIVVLVMMVWAHLEDFESRHIANIIWAFGILGRKILPVQTAFCTFPELYSAILEKVRQMENFKPQEITNIIGGFANLKLRPITCEDTVSHLSKLSLDHIMEFTPRSHILLTWALGTIGIKHEDKLKEAVVQEMQSQIVNLTPQGVTNFIWGLAKQNYKKWSPIYLEIEEYYIMNYSDFIPQGSSNVSWAFAKLRHFPSNEFFNCLDQFCISRLNEFKPQQISNLIYSYAIFGRTLSTGNMTNIMDHVKEYLKSNYQMFNIQPMCNLLWAMSMLNSLDSDILDLTMSEYFSTSVLGKINETEKRQLYQCLLHVEIFSNVEIELDPKYKKDLISVWKSGQESKRVNPISLAVLLTLQELGFVCQNRYSQLDVLVDVALYPKLNKKVAIEISIDRHFFLNDMDRLEGPRLWAISILEKQGYDVLRIREGEWIKLEKEERCDFLKNKLKELNIIEI